LDNSILDTLKGIAAGGFRKFRDYTHTSGTSLEWAVTETADGEILIAVNQSDLGSHMDDFLMEYPVYVIKIDNIGNVSVICSGRGPQMPSCDLYLYDVEQIESKQAEILTTFQNGQNVYQDSDFARGRINWFIEACNYPGADPRIRIKKDCLARQAQQEQQERDLIAAKRALKQKWAAMLVIAICVLILIILL
jgi:hypothetical protein